MKKHCVLLRTVYSVIGVGNVFAQTRTVQDLCVKYTISCVVFFSVLVCDAPSSPSCTQPHSTRRRKIIRVRRDDATHTYYYYYRHDCELRTRPIDFRMKVPAKSFYGECHHQILLRLVEYILTSKFISGIFSSMVIGS